MFFDCVFRYSDDTLGNLLAVKTDLCGKPFEVKINDVIFVGYPLSLQQNFQSEHSKKRESAGATCFSFHIVFALKVRLIPSGVDILFLLFLPSGVPLSFQTF